MKHATLNNINIPTVNIDECYNLTKIYLELQKPVFIHGPIGLGKSSLVQQLGCELFRNVIDLRLSQLDVTDLRGIPFYNTDTKQMNWSLPSFLPTDVNDNSILFLDEFNCANSAIQTAAYQLILDRKIGDYELPKGVSIIAAGNRDKDYGIIFKIAAPLLNRFMHLHVDYDINIWLKWAKENKIHESVITYLTNHPNDLSLKEWQSHLKAFPTPRSWEVVSQIVTLAEKQNNTEYLLTLISGAVGIEVGQKFINSYKTAVVIDWANIVAFNCKTSIDKDLLIANCSLSKTNAPLSEFLDHIDNCINHILALKTTLTINKWWQAVDSSFSFYQTILQRKSQASGKPLATDILHAFVTKISKEHKIKIDFSKVPTINQFLEKHLN